LKLTISDEYAPMKAAKQLRRGKRISEVESKYGKDAVELATIGSPIEEKATPKVSVIPELTPEFFQSAFFRRFQVQREQPIPFHLITADLQARFSTRPISSDDTSLTPSLVQPILGRKVLSSAMSYTPGQHHMESTNTVDWIYLKAVANKCTVSACLNLAKSKSRGKQIDKLVLRK
jgi:hypothetical protein